MPILSLQIDNYKRIETLYIEPSGAVTELTGANGAGKSSALDAAAALLGGKDQIAWKPVRDGAEEAKIVAVLDGVGKTRMKVTRKIRQKEDGGISTTVTVETEDKAKMPTPQAFLDALLSSYALDPLSFLRDEPKDQVAVLQRLSGLDTEKFDAANAADYQKRTEINRQTKELEAQAAGISVPADAPTKRIDESALIAELEKAGEHNAGIERRKAARDATQRTIQLKRSEVKQLEERADHLRREADEIDKSAVVLEGEAKSLEKNLSEAPALPEPVSTATIVGEIEKARTTNMIVDRAERRGVILAQAEQSAAAAKALTEQIARREAEKKSAIAAAKMPIPGLGFGDGMVTFNNRALADVSHAEQIRVSVAIAAALNPTLKIAFIKDGSLLDKKSWALLEQYATEHGLQVFVETVDSSRPTAIVIEDGRARDAKPQLEAAE